MTLLLIYDIINDNKKREKENKRERKKKRTNLEEKVMTCRIRRKIL